MNDPAANWLTPTTHPPLEADEVHVWLVSLAVSLPTVAALVLQLPSAEQERAARFRNDGARTQFVVTRTALRTILGAYVGCSPLEVEFMHGPQGKPALARWPWLYFNVTHSHEIALIAVTRRGEVGVDVERMRPFANDLGMAERYFSPRETAVLRTLTGPARSIAFFNAWTRKEAFLKASGKGISYGLDRVEVTLLPEEEPRFLRIDGSEQLAAAWSLRRLTVAADYLGALTLQWHDYQMRCWRWEEGRTT